MRRPTNPEQFGVTTSLFSHPAEDWNIAYSYCRNLHTRMSRASITAAEWLFIRDVCASFPVGGRYLEIGSHRHVSSCAFLAAMDHNDATLTSVDIVYRLPDFVHPDAGVMDRWTRITGSSLDVVPTLEGPYDVILVDGLHSDIGVLSDTQQAVRLRSPGGVIICHDANSTPAMGKIIEGLGTNELDYYQGQVDHCKGFAVYPKGWPNG